MENGRGRMDDGRRRMDHLKVSHLVIRVQSMALTRKMEEGEWKVENECQASLLFDPGDVLLRTALHGQV